MITLKHLEAIGLIIDSQNGDQVITYCPFHELDTENHRASLSINLKTGLHNCFSGCTHGTFKTLCDNLKVKMPDIAFEKNDEEKIMKKYRHELKLEFVDTISCKRMHREFGEFIDGLPYAVDEPFLHSRGINNESVYQWEIKRNKFGISFPIRNKSGIITGVLSRMYKGDNKYLYSKGFQRIIFGMNHYSYAPNSYVILVEGSLDCIWMHQCGYVNTVSSLGVTIVKQAMQELLSLHNKILLLMDNDEAGKEATSKLYQILKNKFGMRVFLPNYDFYLGKDPNDLTKNQIDNLIESMSEPKREIKKYLEVI